MALKRLIPLLFLLFPFAAGAAPQAALLMDTRNGQVYLAEDADKQLHPASLTKMMTLYIAFQAAGAGEVDLDAQVTVSAKAAAVTGSSLHLQTGERISLRDLVTATAIKSANDAATALAEAISGTTENFVARMNTTAARIGMTRTHFRNPHGLTADGHLSTARDMSLLARQLFFDHPAYFDLFSKVHASAGGRKIAHTNRRFLGAYSGADGIKTGYTRAAGYNLTASAQRGQKRLIVTVFGARSSADRTARVAALMNKGFRAALPQVEWVPPAPSRPNLPGHPAAVPLLVSTHMGTKPVRGPQVDGTPHPKASRFGSVLNQAKTARLTHSAGDMGLFRPDRKTTNAPLPALRAASLGGVSLGAILR
ncbi:D-alanyl-D-alanine carboxypeptidase family protein [Primorskyibacter marinus]|uniref:D-alanyl-D-alanine carboxypeptidase family protein n=1 Tax=Primorskyibacter marinus TaxID=1977320 RepID=UPI000E30AEFA|nr:D-alanyl-D-alanine carboxypeptidase family protein [Primorskyibacter marinus]